MSIRKKTNVAPSQELPDFGPIGSIEMPDPQPKPDEKNEEIKIETGKPRPESETSSQD